MDHFSLNPFSLWWPLGEKERNEGETSSATGDSQQPTVIQIPDNLLPMFGIKKDPVKIGKFCVMTNKTFSELFI